jgi:DNA-binding NtrC family response regulator
MYKPPVNEYQRAVEQFKREFLALTLAAHRGNRSRAARALGVQRTYFVRLIRQFGLAERVPAASVRRPA